MKFFSPFYFTMVSRGFWFVGKSFKSEVWRKSVSEVHCNLYIDLFGFFSSALGLFYLFCTPNVQYGCEKQSWNVYLGVITELCLASLITWEKRWPFYYFWNHETFKYLCGSQSALSATLFVTWRSLIKLCLLLRGYILCRLIISYLYMRSIGGVVFLK